MSMHLPMRPGWTCQACGLAWPCPSRQRQLLAEYAGARVSLMLYLSGYFVEACADLHTVAAGTLYRRFFTWPYEMRRNTRW
ncbi:MAG TPA: flavin reductase [Micromonosporaceae bacterium]